MSGLDLVAIGEGMVEFSADGGSAAADLFRRGFAGDVVNTLIHASRLGLRTGLVSRIGDDLFAPALVRAWSEEGIDLSHAPVVEGDNGVYFIVTDDWGERGFAYRRAGSAASRMGPGDLDADFLRGSRMALLSGIAQAISPSAEALVAAAARCGIRAAYDPNYRPQLWSRRGGAGAARAAFGSVAPFVDWLLPSWPADLPLLGDTLDLPADEALRRFAATGADVALKIGAAGVLLSVGGRVTHVPAIAVERVVDSTGAGDAWNAAFLAGLLQGGEPADTAARANAHAASTLGHRGAIPPRA